MTSIASTDGEKSMREAQNIAYQIIDSGSFAILNFRQIFDSAVTRRAINLVPENKLPWKL